jgi:hypothetical protein
MIEVFLEKGAERIRLTASDVEFSRQKGKKRLTRKWSTPVDSQARAELLLVEDMAQSMLFGFTVTSVKGIDRNVLDNLRASLVAENNELKEMVTLAMANDSTRDIAEVEIPALAQCLSLSLRDGNQKQVVDTKDAEGIYTIGTVHSGCAHPGSRMEVFLAAIAWRFSRPLISGTSNIDPRLILGKVDIEIREKLAELGYAPVVLQLKTAVVTPSLVW